MIPIHFKDLLPSHSVFPFSGLQLLPPTHQPLLQPLASYSHGSLHKLKARRSEDRPRSASSCHCALYTSTPNAVGQWVEIGPFGAVVLFEHGESHSEVGWVAGHWMQLDLAMWDCSVGLRSCPKMAQVSLGFERGSCNTEC